MTSTLMNGISPENIGANGTVRNAVKQPYIEIVEQPASKALRFRYECEGRSAGSIPGVHNTPEHKTYPTVRIVGFKGPAVIIVSCVTKDEPYRAHPHNLVGKENCRDGICTMEINNDSMTATFSNLGIQCVKKKDIEDALRIREEKRVDPFRQGFAHSANASSIDLNAVRLSFQAFLRGSEPKKYQVLTPVVSDVIYDKKAMSDLVITKLSHSSAPALSRQEMILLCEKVAKEDIQIRFFEERNNEVVWEATGDFTPTQVHKQVAIWFKTPQYPGISEMEGSVNVFIQLKRPSDNAVSEPLPFKFRPEDPEYANKKRKRTLEDTYKITSHSLIQQQQSGLKNVMPGVSASYMSPPQPFQIKDEPRSSPDCPRYADLPQYTSLAPSPLNNYPTYSPSLPSYSELRNSDSEQPNPAGYPGMLEGYVSLRPVQQVYGEEVQVTTVSSSELFPPNRTVNLSSLERLDSTDFVHVDEMMLSESMNQSLNIAPNEESNMNDSLTNLANRTFDREYKQL